MDFESLFGDETSCHYYWKMHLFAALIVGVLGVVCIMSGALAQLGIVLLSLSIGWGVVSWAVGMHQCRNDTRRQPPSSTAT